MHILFPETNEPRGNCLSVLLVWLAAFVLVALFAWWGNSL